MEKDNGKVLTTFCPFQTQIVKLSGKAQHGDLILGPTQPQIIKIPCDREKCQLWVPDANACAVSVMVMNLGAQITAISQQEFALRDIADHLAQITAEITALQKP